MISMNSYEQSLLLYEADVYLFVAPVFILILFLVGLDPIC